MASDRDVMPGIDQMAGALSYIYVKYGRDEADHCYRRFVREHNLSKDEKKILVDKFYELITRKGNPVPPSSRAGENRIAHGEVEKARLLYEKFTGHDAVDEVVIDKPVMPDVMCVIGDIDGIMYTTVRDGKTEKYLHKFKKSARPLFCVSPDGLSLYLIGGSYQFGERGIVDK